jgi:small subunit ribosomal protein S27Ae
MAKARVGLYSTKGEQLVRTHKMCPKCGPGTFLAEHNDRRSCGKCGYSEPRTDPKPVPAPTLTKGKAAKAA